VLHRDGLTSYPQCMGAIRTIDQKQERDSIVKAAELMEIRGAASLTLHDRRVLNLLIQNAGTRICDEVEHVIAIRDLRGNHKGGERSKDSVGRLMRVILEVPCKGRNGKPATKMLPFLAETTVSDDDEDPTGEVVYYFSKGIRAIVKNSTVWGKLRTEVIFAFTSKYSLALYELISKRIHLKHIWQEDFTLTDFRALLGVPADKLQRTPDLLRFAVRAAETEVNGLADFGVKIEPIRAGGQKRGTVTGFRLSWWRKNPDQLKEAYSELQRSKVGRIARLTETVEQVDLDEAIKARKLPPPKAAAKRAGVRR
jgi:hypothetical protein